MARADVSELRTWRHFSAGVRAARDPTKGRNGALRELAEGEVIFAGQAMTSKDFV